MGLNAEYAELQDRFQHAAGSMRGIVVFQTAELRMLPISAARMPRLQQVRVVPQKVQPPKNQVTMDSSKLIDDGNISWCISLALNSPIL